MCWKFFGDRKREEDTTGISPSRIRQSQLRGLYIYNYIYIIILWRRIFSSAKRIVHLQWGGPPKRGLLKVPAKGRSETPPIHLHGLLSPAISLGFPLNAFLENSGPRNSNCASSLFCKNNGNGFGASRILEANPWYMFGCIYIYIFYIYIITHTYLYIMCIYIYIL